MHTTSLTNPSMLDVAIVGFGPVGATLCGLLGQAGCRVGGFDRAEEIYPLPRAFALDQEAMRVFQRLGIAASLEPTMEPYRPTVYLGAAGQPIQRFDMGQPPFPLGWKPAYTFNQPALEAALRGAVGALDAVDVQLGREVVRIEQHEDWVEFDVRDASGATQTWGARYLVGCDGGSSFVRKQSGLRLHSLEFDEPWAVVDVHVNEEKLDELPQTNIQYCLPQGPCTYVVGPGTHRRWEFMLSANTIAAQSLPEEELWALLEPWLMPHEARIWRAATYRFHAVVAEQWRKGRVLLAGDSAHQMPPFLAQGMCQGIRDVNNLAWKLSRVVKGLAPDSVLESYTGERRPQVEETTRIVKSLGEIICQRDPVLAAHRDAGMLQEQGGVVKSRIRQNLLPGLAKGILDRRSACAGTPIPQPLVRIGDGSITLMDDALEDGFVMFLRELPAPAIVAAMLRALRQLGGQLVLFGAQTAPSEVIALREVDGLLDSWMSSQDCIAVLVRPDHVVFGVASSHDGALALLFEATAQVACEPVVN